MESGSDVRALTNADSDMGAKNRNTARAKHQEQLDSLRAQITTWYMDERLTSLGIQEKLKAYGLDLTIGQVHFAIHRFGLKRDRNTRSERLLTALKNRKHASRPCRHCGVAYEPASGAQVYCSECAPTKVFCRRIQNYGVGKREFDAMFQAQNGLCAICDKPLGEENVAVDHDHETLQIRGLLCRPCNLRLAVVEDTKFVERATAYLQCSFRATQSTVETT